MKKQIEQLLSGKFKYDQPRLLFSKDKLSITLEAGKTARGELYLGTEDNDKIKGYITSSNRRLVPGSSRFSGTTGQECSRARYVQAGFVLLQA